MKHYLEEIIRDHKNLNKQIIDHLKGCILCQKELTIINKIQAGVESIPDRTIPFEFKQELLALIQRPKYKIWYYLLTTILLALSPLLIGRLLLSSNNGISHDMTVIIYSLFGFISVVMLIPIAMKLLHEYHHSINEIEKTFDEYLDDPMRMFHR